MAALLQKTVELRSSAGDGTPCDVDGFTDLLITGSAPELLFVRELRKGSRGNDSDGGIVRETVKL